MSTDSADINAENERSRERQRGVSEDKKNEDEQIREREINFIKRGDKKMKRIK